MESVDFKRKTIGVLINAMDDPYQCKIWQGIKKHAEEKDYNVLFFSGMALQPIINDCAQQNVLYYMINSNKLDGIIIASGTMDTFVDIEYIHKYENLFTGIPIVSISIPLSGAYNILLDNEEATRKAIEHMLKEHNRLRIAFISGADTNWEANVRRNTFIKMMEKNGRSYEELVYIGDFLEESGGAAVDFFRENCKQFPDAIIAANDDMAIGAYLRLQELGIEVPKDVSIIGFDNIDRSVAFFPPFTTVSQPVLHMAYKAVEIIDDIISGKAVERNNYFSGELIIRESCGCFNIMKGKIELRTEQLIKVDLPYEEALNILQDKLQNQQEQFSVLLTKNRSLTSSEILLYQNFSKSLIEGLLLDLKNEKIEGQFLETLNYILNHTITIKKMDFLWQEILIGMRSFIMSQLNHSKMLSLMHDIFYMASILAGNFMMRKELLYNFYFNKMYVTSRKVIKDFNAVIYLEDLTQILFSTMSSYGITQYYLCLYDQFVIHEKHAPFISPNKIRLVMGCNNGTIIRNEYFNTKEMLPDGYLGQINRVDLIFYTLFSENTHYGYIVFNLNAVDMLIFETLRDQISHSLKSINLYNQRKMAEERLSCAVSDLEKYNKKLHTLSTHDELTGLLNRRGFYMQAEKNYVRASTLESKFHIIFGDLDGLKEINDTYGHNEGDFAIVTAAKILKRCFRKGDSIARMSGDEFTVIIEHMEAEEGIHAMINKIKSAFAKFNEEGVKPYKISMSIGHASYQPELAETLDDVIRKADRQLYEDKKLKH